MPPLECGARGGHCEDGMIARTGKRNDARPRSLPECRQGRGQVGETLGNEIDEAR
jgi:hypothetical protein